jgi:hypothetical protein
MNAINIIKQSDKKVTPLSMNYTKRTQWNNYRRYGY